MRKSTNKYPNGYENKIVYWTEKFAEAMSNEDREIAQSKIDYFTKRQNEFRNAVTKGEMSKFEILEFMVDNPIIGREAQLVDLIFNTKTANEITSQQWDILALRMIQNK